jgi:uncharacterized protein YacL
VSDETLQHESGEATGDPLPRLPRRSLSPFETAERQRAILTRIVRLAFVVIFVTFTVLALLDTDSLGQGILAPGGIALKNGWSTVALVAFSLAAAVIFVDVVTARKKVSALVSIFLGLVFALLATYALGKILDLLAQIYDVRNAGLLATSKILIGIGLAYLSIITILQTQDDFRLVVPYVEFTKQLRGARPIVADTSSLIDGRIADLASTGILQSPIVVPAFVIAELQTLADQGDAGKRARGRRGLDIVSRLQRTPGLDVTIDQAPMPGKGVDQMLIELATRQDAMVLTGDTGLARVASIQGVRTLNLNDVANAVKPTLLAGDRVTVRLVKAGEQPGQGVGYLDDGTMVVAEDGREHVGQTVALVVVTMLQTSAGRLIFARLAEGAGEMPPRDRSEPPAMSGGAAIDEATLPPTSVALPEAPARSPFPPKQANKRFNSSRNPRR